MNVTTLAGLAGIGTVFLTGTVLTGITNELWFLRIVATDGPPPRIDELLLVKWFAGSFVAARLGGARAVGIVCLYALVAMSLTIFRFAIEAPLSALWQALGTAQPIPSNGSREPLGSSRASWDSCGSFPACSSAC